MRKVEYWFKNCFAEETDVYKGIFHRCTEVDGETKALLEADNGNVFIVPFNHIRFTEPYQEPVKKEQVLYDADIEKLDWNVGDKVHYNGLNLIATEEKNYADCSDCEIKIDVLVGKCKFVDRCIEAETVFKQI